MQAIILAGGKGERLRPLTAEKPKPMISVMDKPLMEYSIELLKKHNIVDIGITLKFLPEQIKRYFKDGSAWNVNIEYFEEREALGTAGGVKAAQDFINDTFIVISGDALTNIDIDKILTFHKAKNSDVTIVTKRVDDPSAYGGVVCDTSCRVLSFEEKPEWENVISDIVNTGIYIIEPKILQEIPSNNFFDFAKDLFPQILNKYNVFSYITEDYWCDLGTHQSFIKAHKDILQGEVLGEVNVLMGKNVKIAQSAKINPPVYIGEDTIIGENAIIGPFATIGKNSIIENSSVTDSVLFEKAIISKTQIKNSVIGENTRITDCVLGGENIIGSNVVLNVNSHVAAQKIIDNNLIFDGEEVSFLQKSVWQNGKICGIWNHDIYPSHFSALAAEQIGEFIAIGYNNLALSYSCANLCASFASLAGKTAYVSKCTLSAFKYFCYKNQCCGIYIKNFEELLKISVINDKGLEITSENERKINFDKSCFSLKQGRIIRLSTLDADFEYLLDSTFPFSSKNVQIFSEYKLRLHNVINAEYNTMLANTQILEKEGVISEIKYKNKRLPTENFYLLKVALSAFYGAQNVFLPDYVGQEVIDFAKNNNITVLKQLMHRGNRYKNSKNFVSFEVLLDSEPYFFAQALSYYLSSNEISVDKNKIIVQKKFYLPKSKTCKVVSLINKEKNSKITVIPFSSGNGFTLYANSFYEEYSPDVFDEVISKVLFDKN